MSKVRSRLAIVPPILPMSSHHDRFKRICKNGQVRRLNEHRPHNFSWIFNTYITYNYSHIYVNYINLYVYRIRIIISDQGASIFQKIPEVDANIGSTSSKCQPFRTSRTWDGWLLHYDRKHKTGALISPNDNRIQSTVIYIMDHCQPHFFFTIDSPWKILKNIWRAMNSVALTQWFSESSPALHTILKLSPAQGSHCCGSMANIFSYIKLLHVPETSFSQPFADRSVNTMLFNGRSNTASPVTKSYHQNWSVSGIRYSS